MEKRRTPLTIGWQAARANAMPGLILQATMLATLVAYYASPDFAALLDRLAHYKQEHSTAFVIAAGVLAARFSLNFSLSLFFREAKRDPRICEISPSPFRHGVSTQC